MTAAYIRHPDLPDRVVEVPAAAVPHYRATGWETAPAPQPKPKLQPDDEKADTDAGAGDQADTGPLTPETTPDANAAGAADDQADAETAPDSETPKRRTRNTSKES